MKFSVLNEIDDIIQLEVLKEIALKLDKKKGCGCSSSQKTKGSDAR